MVLTPFLHFHVSNYTDSINLLKALINIEYNKIIADIIKKADLEKSAIQNNLIDVTIRG